MGIEGLLVLGWALFIALVTLYLVKRGFFPSIKGLNIYHKVRRAFSQPSATLPEPDQEPEEEEPDYTEEEPAEEDSSPSSSSGFDIGTLVHLMIGLGIGGMMLAVMGSVVSSIVSDPTISGLNNATVQQNITEGFGAITTMTSMLPVIVLILVMVAVLTFIFQLVSFADINEQPKKKKKKHSKTGIRGLDMYEKTRRTYSEQPKRVRKHQ